MIQYYFVLGVRSLRRNPVLTALMVLILAVGVAASVSTLIGCSVLNWLMLATMEWLKTNGHPLPVLRSQNLPGAIEHNRAVGAKYKARLSRQLA